MTHAEMERLYTVELLSTQLIAERAGMRKNSIARILRNRGVQIRGKSEARRLACGTADFWTPHRVAILRKMWNNHQGGNLIAAAIGHGCTKSMVYTKRVELRMAEHGRSPKRKTEREIATAAQAKRAAAEFRHESLIRFPGALQWRWIEALNEVRAMRGRV